MFAFSSVVFIDGLKFSHYDNSASYSHTSKLSQEAVRRHSSLFGRGGSNMSNNQHDGRLFAMPLSSYQNSDSMSLLHPGQYARLRDSNFSRCEIGRDASDCSTDNTGAWKWVRDGGSACQPGIGNARKHASDDFDESYFRMSGDSFLLRLRNLDAMKYSGTMVSEHHICSSLFIYFIGKKLVLLLFSSTIAAVYWSFQSSIIIANSSSAMALYSISRIAVISCILLWWIWLLKVFRQEIDITILAHCSDLLNLF